MSDIIESSFKSFMIAMYGSSKICPPQYSDMQRAFFSGVGICVSHLMEDIAEVKDPDRFAIFKKELLDYLNAQIREDEKRMEEGE